MTNLIDIERAALRLWQKREKTFPKFVRRMQPDDFDRMSGAWGAIVEEAANDAADKGALL